MFIFTFVSNLFDFWPLTLIIFIQSDLTIHIKIEFFRFIILEKLLDYISVHFYKIKCKKYIENDIWDTVNNVEKFCKHYSNIDKMTLS